MALVATKISADRYCIKYLITHTGGTGAVEDDLTISNAQLMLDMADGPLKDLWAATYDNVPAARAALTEGPHLELFDHPRSSTLGATEAAPWGFDCDTDANPGKPRLLIFGDAHGIVHLTQMNYRHSTGR